MPRRLRSLLIVAGVALALWRFGALDALAWVWNMFGSGTRAITGETAIDVGQDTKRALVQSNLSRALREYRATVGEEPTSLGSLVDAGLLQRADVRDEWNRPLVGAAEGSRFVVRSLGRDGQAGTDDDWTLGH